MRRHFTVLVVTMAALLSAVREVAGQITYQTNALSGQSAPGTSAGVAYSSFLTAPAINDAGQLGFGASLRGTGEMGSNAFALFAEALRLHS